MSRPQQTAIQCPVIERIKGLPNNQRLSFSQLISIDFIIKFLNLNKRFKFDSMPKVPSQPLATYISRKLVRNSGKAKDSFMSRARFMWPCIFSTPWWLRPIHPCRKIEIFRRVVLVHPTTLLLKKMGPPLQPPWNFQSSSMGGSRPHIQLLRLMDGRKDLDSGVNLSLRILD